MGWYKVWYEVGLGLVELRFGLVSGGRRVALQGFGLVQADFRLGKRGAYGCFIRSV